MIASIKKVSRRRRYANVCIDVVLHDLSVTYSDKNEDLCVSYPVFSFRHSNHWKLSWTLAFRYQLSYLKKGETYYFCKSFECGYLLESEVFIYFKKYCHKYFISLDNTLTKFFTTYIEPLSLRKLRH